MSRRIKKLYRDAGIKPPKGKGVHTVKFHKCVVAVKKKGGNVNPYAVCMASIGKKGAVKKSHRRNKKGKK